MDVTDLTAEFISIPSPNLPGDERAIALAVQDAAEACGLDRGVIVAEEPHRPNVIIEVPFGPGGRRLAMSGHIDTKPIGDAVWMTDPLTPTVVDGRMYGLGTCDMKGGVAAMIIAAGRVAADPPTKGSLVLVFTADEEYGSRYGSRFLAEQRALHADAIVIGEPGGVSTDWDAVHIVSRGIANVYIDVEGRQGHSSLSQVKGYTSATQVMARLITRFAQEFMPSHPEHFLNSHPTVNTGVMVSGGVGFGVVPGLATFASDIRLTPGMERDTFEADLQAFLAAAMSADPELRATFRLEAPPRDWLPPTEVDRDHPIVHSCQAALLAVLGHDVPLAVFPGTTDAAWLQGMLGIPTLPAFGPGLLEHAHAANEFVALDALRASVDIYEHVIRDFCSGDA